MTLTQTAIFTKRAILGFIIFSILGTVSFIGYKIWYASYLASLPPQQDLPDTKFGILPQPDFPASKVPSSNFSYSLDTATGSLPDFGKLIKVYFMPKASATFLAPEKGQALAEKFKISSPPEILSETKQRFTQDNRILIVELDTGNFIYQTNTTPSATTLEDDQRLTQDFKNFLQQIGVLKEGLNSDRIRIKPLKFDGSQFSVTDNKPEASGALINLWPGDIDKMPIVTSSFDKSLVQAEIINSARVLENIRSLNFIFWPVDTSTYATYRLKPPTTAFEELKSGKGIVVVRPTSSQVSITSIYLGYFESENYTPYLQPVFVFEGPGFVAYVSALTDEFLSQ